jgi:hypothetical protein
MGGPSCDVPVGNITVSEGLISGSVVDDAVLQRRRASTLFHAVTNPAVAALHKPNLRVCVVFHAMVL